MTATPTSPGVPTTITNLPPAGTVNGSEFVVIVQNGVTVRATTQQIVLPGGPISAVNGGTGITTSTVAGVVTVNLTIPVPIASGGTNATTAAQALTNLGALSTSAGMAVATYDPAAIAQQVVGLTAPQAITNKSVNGVTLSSSGSATNFLNNAGAYISPFSALASFTGVTTVTINASTNIASIVRTATGRYTVTMTTPPTGGTNYVVLSLSSRNTATASGTCISYDNTVTRTSTVFGLINENIAGTLEDALLCTFAVIPL